MATRNSPHLDLPTAIPRALQWAHTVVFGVLMTCKATSHLAQGFLVLLLSLAGPLPLSAAAGGAPTGLERAAAAGKGLIGSPAPRTVVKTIDGQQIDLGSLYGK